MAIKIRFDLAGNPEPPTIILANRNGNKLGQLKINTDSIELSDKLNDASEISFTINKYVNGVITPLWDKVVDFKLVYCKEWDAWFEIRVELDEKTETVKTVFCTHLGQAELSQLVLYNVEINTEQDIERDDYKISILYDSDIPEASILNRILKDKAPHYRIRYVSPTIAKIQRSFSFDGVSILDAFNDIAEEVGCLFQYYAFIDSDGILRREISVYDLQQYCNECGHRGEYTDKCPKCNSTNITNGYGEDTLIFVTSDELASNGIQLTTDTNSVKNCFKLEAGDDLMTAAIRSCNPNGTDYIWYFSDDIKEDMSDELVERLNSYNEIYKKYCNEYVSNIDSGLLSRYNNLVDKYSVYNEDLQKITTPITGYPSLMNAYYNAIDFELYLKSGLMPSVEMSDTNASEQLKLLTAASLSPVAVADVTVASLATINSAVLAMAKTIIRPTYKVQIGSSELIDGGNSRSWKGNFIVTNYSDEEDEAVGSAISITINDDLESFVKQKIEKALNKENTDDLSISGLFKKEYSDFCAELKKYALNPLISFNDACQSCVDIMIDQGVGSGESWSDEEDGSEANLYEKLYLPYYNKLKAIEAEIKVREDEIFIISGKYNTDGDLVADGLKTSIESCKIQIQDALNFNDYLGDKLWLEFCAYRREDKYSNENYISDGLDNAELFKRALELFEIAENEIYKSAELQHSISATLNNLLSIKKFKPLVDNFNVGNWIRVRVDDEIYKLRLLEYGIGYGDFNNISVEFSDVYKIKNGVTDVKDVLEQASSMATSYDSVQRQASQGSSALGTIDQWLLNGLNSANVQIQNNDSEEITFSKNGLLGRSYDEITGTYSPEQFRLTHNIMAYTTDDWKTVSAALGKHEYTKWKDNRWIKDVGYGLSSTFVTAGYVTGSQIIGGEIVSSNYKTGESGTYFDLINGDFEIAGGNIVYDTKDKALTLKNVTIEWSSTTKPTVTDVSGLEDYLEQLENLEDQLDGRAQTWYQNTDPSVDWKTDGDKSLHIGDLWHYTGETGTVNGVKRTKNSEWIWKKVGNAYQWVSIEVSDDVFDAIDGKAQVFTSTPTPPYYVGDLWVQGSNGEIMRCMNERKTGSYAASDWEKASKYTDDAVANNAKSIAENAKAIGDTLVNGLGFEETEITGKYVISPVIAGGYLLIGDKSGVYAEISTDGALKCTGAEISGNVQADSGSIGSWTIGEIGSGWGSSNYPNSLYSVTTIDSTDYLAFLRIPATDTGNVFAIRTRDSDGKVSTPFYVNKNGAMYASDAEIVGKITATSGEFTGKITSESGNISGWNLKDNSIYNSGSDDWSENGTFMCTGTRGSYTIGGKYTNEWVFGAGGKFGVTKSGAVWCSDIHANGGEIGGCSIVDGVLKIKNANITERLTTEQIDGSSLNITKGSTIGGWSVSDSGISYLEYMDNGVNFDNGVWFSGTQLGVVLNAGDTWEFIPWRNVYDAAFGYSGLAGRVKDLEDNNLSARVALIESKLGIVKSQ
jgi:hypothetical protein